MAVTESTRTKIALDFRPGIFGQSHRFPSLDRAPEGGPELAHLGSVWGRFRVDLGSIGGRFGVGFGSIWGRFGIDLGSVWGRFGVDLGSIW